MNQSLTGAEFAARVAGTLRRNLENPELVAILFETCQHEGMSASFDELALKAKGFQKIARLLATDRVGDETKEKAKAELESLIEQFSELVGIILSKLPAEKRKEFRVNFLLPTPASFRNLRALLNDFVKVKDFLLQERDKGAGR